MENTEAELLSQFCYLPAMWPWTSHFPRRTSGFPSVKWGVKTQSMVLPICLITTKAPFVLFFSLHQPCLYKQTTSANGSRGKRLRFEVSYIYIEISAPQFISCVTLGKSLSLSEPDWCCFSLSFFPLPLPPPTPFASFLSFLFLKSNIMLLFSIKCTQSIQLNKFWRIKTQMQKHLKQDLEHLH